MKKIIISTFAISALLFTTSCEDDFDTDVQDIVVTKGEADFSNYISIGNSLTSGYRDNALYIDGQNESYPNIIAGQMKLAGGGNFVQPLMADNNGGLILLGNTIQATKLYIKSFTNGSPDIVNVAATPTTDVLTKITGPLNNFGVPGAKSYHLVASGYGNAAGILLGTANPYYVRFSTSTTSTVIDDAVLKHPTFFSYWIGNNDVLSYATNGGTNSTTVGGVTTYTPATVQTSVDATTYKPNDISSPTLVAGAIKAGLDKLKAGGTTKGVIANIPYVTSIPFFTTVPYNPLTPALLGSNITALNTNIYGPLKQVLTGLGAGDRFNLLSATNTNPVLIKDTSLTDYNDAIRTALTPALGLPTATLYGQLYGQARQATVEDYVLLTTKSVIGTNATGIPTGLNVYGISYPLQNQHILTKTETGVVKTAVDAYNTSIKALADTYGLAFVDANKKMVDLNGKSGISWDGVKYSAKFVTGGTFSLDGVHLTGRGYAIVANEFIKAINDKYKSTLPQVDPNKYSGVKFP